MRELLSDDWLSRFLFSSSHFAGTRGRVKGAAFVPAKGDGRTSVFLTSHASEREVWRVADEYVASVRQLPVLGRGDVTAAAVAGAGLTIEPSEPPPGHCNIASWPAEKYEMMEWAQRLADAATLVLRSRA